jgi:outer membrane protein TolC
VKGQQLFHSFLPGVTAAVLTTQPAWAGTVKVNGVQLASSGNVLTSIYGQNLVADDTNTQTYTADQRFPSLLVSTHRNLLDAKPLTKPLRHHSSPIIEAKNASSINSQIFRINQGRFYNPSPISDATQKLDINRSPDSDQEQNNSATSGQKLKNLVVPTTNSKIPSVRQNNFLMSSAQQPTNEKKNPDTQLQRLSQTANQNVEMGKLLEIPSCSQQEGKEKTAASAYLHMNGTCQQTTAARDLLAQTNTQTVPGTVTPTPANSVPLQTVPGTVAPTPANSVPLQTVPGTVTPAPANSVPLQTVPGTATPAPAGSVQVPENLVPNPNPLQFPTKPEEVTLQANQPITLEQALEIAKRNNRELQVAQLELERSQAALREAQAALLPNVGISADLTRQRTVGDTYRVKLQEQQQSALPPPFRQPIEPAPTNTNLNGQAQISYDIYTSGRRNASIKAAEEQVRVSELAVESQFEDIRLNVATDYYNLQQADEQVRIAQSAVTNAQASLRDAEALERAGVGTRFDVLRSQVNLANSQQELITAISQQQIARRRLATRLSLPQSLNISAADPVRLAGLWNQTLEQSIVLAFQNRPELQQQLAQRNISEQQRRQALAALGPQVSLVASYDLFDQFNDDVSVSDGYSVGVRATLNLYDGGAARARAAQARANIAIAETGFAEQRNQIRFQVEEAFSDQQSNLENVQTANAALEQAREALRLARLRFQAGVGTQTDVINSENDLTRSEGNRIRAILDYNRALARLQRSVTSRAFRQ